MPGHSRPTLGDWLLASRPKTLPAAIAPLLVAISLAYASPYPVNHTLVVLALLCSLCLQVLVNFANDYSDAHSGVDTEARIGPKRATQSGLISAPTMKRAILWTALLTLSTGLPLIWSGGWPIALVGVCCILAALAYSGGPFPLASHALGEFTVLLFFGFVAVVGGSYVLTQALIPESWLLALISGLPISAIMLVNNTRDMTTDKPAGKNTLPVCIGRELANKLYAIMVLMPGLLGIAAFLLNYASGYWAIAGLLSFPLAIRLTRRFKSTQGAGFNELLAATAQYSLLNSTLYSAAIGLTSFI